MDNSKKVSCEACGKIPVAGEKWTVFGDALFGAELWFCSEWCMHEWMSFNAKQADPTK